MVCHIQLTNPVICHTQQQQLEPSSSSWNNTMHMPTQYIQQQAELQVHHCPLQDPPDLALVAVAHAVAAPAETMAAAAAVAAATGPMAVAAAAAAAAATGPAGVAAAAADATAAAAAATAAAATAAAATGAAAEVLRVLRS